MGIWHGHFWTVPFSPNDVTYPEYEAIKSRRRLYADNIQRSLTDHLFCERGYRISGATIE